MTEEGTTDPSGAGLRSVSALLLLPPLSYSQEISYIF